MRRLIVILASVAMLLTFVPIVNAGQQGSCSNAARVNLRENIWGDGSDGNDQLWLCGTGSNYPNLGNVSHTLSGGCNAPFKVGDNWNDCVDAFHIWLPSNLYRFCAYNDASWGGGVVYGIQGPRTAFQGDVNPADHDQISSVRIRYLSSSC